MDHQCTGDVETCPVCSQRRDEIESPATPVYADEQYQLDRMQDRYERQFGWY